MTGLANQAAIAIDNALLYNKDTNRGNHQK